MMLAFAVTTSTATVSGFNGIVTPKTVEAKMLVTNKFMPAADIPCSKYSALVYRMCSITSWANFCAQLFLHMKSSWTHLFFWLWLAGAMIGCYHSGS